MFENLHRNKKWAFIDGALSATMLVCFVGKRYLDRRDQKTEESHREEMYRVRSEAFKSGWEGATEEAARWMTAEEYKRMTGRERGW